MAFNEVDKKSPLKSLGPLRVPFKDESTTHQLSASSDISATSCRSIDGDGNSLRDDNTKPKMVSMAPSLVTNPPPASKLEHQCKSFSYSSLDAEKILDRMGKYGRYQMLVYAMSSLGSLMFACETMVMSLITVVPDFECRLTELGLVNKTLSIIDKCTVADVISGRRWECGRGPESYFVYNNTDGHITLSSEFDLVCSQEYWKQHGTSLFMIGGMITTPFLIQLADRYGRRFTFLIPFWLTVLSNIACSVTPSYFYFLIFRFLAGLGTAGIGTVGYVIMIEGVAPSFRSVAPMIASFVWVAGYLMVGVLHLLIYNWRWLYFTISAPGLLSFVFYWYLPESLHWLITNKKTKQVSKYIQNSVKMNKIEIVLHECRTASAIDRRLIRELKEASLDQQRRLKNTTAGIESLADVAYEHCELRPLEIETADDTEIANKQSTGRPVEKKKRGGRGFTDMFRFKPLVFHLLLHCFIMITMNFTYWALSLFSVDLHEDEMVGYFLSGIVELPAGFVSLVLLFYYGRRTITFVSLFAQALAMFATVLLPGKSYLSMFFPLLAKICNSVAWTSEPLLLGEMSPTSLRNTFYGSVSFAGEIGSVLAPYLNILKNFHESAPPLLICVMSIVAAFAALCSPETKDHPMPQDLSDFNAGHVYNLLFEKSENNLDRKHLKIRGEQVAKSDVLTEAQQPEEKVEDVPTIHI